MSQKPTTIDEYIATLPKNVQAILQKIRRTIQAAAPQATETISYGIPTFKLDGTYLIYFAGWQDHVSIYPTPGGITAFEDELRPYKKAKGTVSFPLDQPIPYELIKKIVKFRMQASE